MLLILVIASFKTTKRISPASMLPFKMHFSGVLLLASWFVKISVYVCMLTTVFIMGFYHCCCYSIQCL